MHKFFKSLLLSGLVICGATALAPQAEAVDIQIDNRIGKRLAVAVVYCDENRDSAWRCKGWFMVDGNAFKTLHFPSHNADHIWVHMHNSGRSWGGTKGWTVIGSGFDYRLTSGCPQGANRRQVSFRNYNIGQDGVVRLVAK